MTDEGIAGGCFDSSQKALVNPGSFMSYCGVTNNANGLGWQSRQTFLPPVANYIRQTAEGAKCLTAPPNPKVALLNPIGSQTFKPNDTISVQWISDCCRLCKFNLFK